MNSFESRSGKPTVFEKALQRVDWSRLDSQLQKEWEEYVLQQLAGQIMLSGIPPEDRQTIKELTSEIFADVLAIFDIHRADFKSFTIKADLPRQHSANFGEVINDGENNEKVRVRFDDVNDFVKTMADQLFTVKDPVKAVLDMISIAVHELHHVDQDVHDRRSAKLSGGTAEVQNRLTSLRDKIRRVLWGKGWAEKPLGKWVLKEADAWVAAAQDVYQEDEGEVAGDAFVPLYMVEKYKQLKAKEADLSEYHARLLHYLPLAYEKLTGKNIDDEI
jgi:hypothetical protein